MPVLRGSFAEWRFVYPAVFSSRTTAGNLQEAIAAQAQVRRRHSAHARPILWQRQHEPITVTRFSSVNLRDIMKNRKTHPVNEFRAVDDHGKEYTVLEYQEGTEKQSLKWIKAGPTWYCLSDGTAVDKIDDNTFKIPMIDRVLHRRP